MQSSVSPVQTNFRIRRVGNLGNIPTFEPAVGLFVDGAFRSRAIFGATDLFDIERIEILRGPQSTLYGKNTTAGVIGIYTAPPSDASAAAAKSVSATIDGGAGDATSTQVKAGLSGPLGRRCGAGLGGSYTAQRRDDGRGARRTAASRPTTPIATRCAASLTGTSPTRSTSA